MGFTAHGLNEAGSRYVKEMNTMAEKIKMDKVRRLLINRYGVESQEAVLKLLGLVLDDYVEVLMESETSDFPKDELALAQKALRNLVDRANAEPVTVEVED